MFYVHISNFSSAEQKKNVQIEPLWENPLHAGATLCFHDLYQQRLIWL